jgi:4'-phosphopantetheinyl transferase
VGPGILRKIIPAYLVLAPGEVRFVYNKYSKRFISDDQNCGALEFNLSYYNGMALYAFTRGRRIGVDLEYMQEDFATLGGGRAFLLEK